MTKLAKGRVHIPGSGLTREAVQIPPLHVHLHGEFMKGGRHVSASAQQGLDCFGSARRLVNRDGQVLRLGVTEPLSKHKWESCKAALRISCDPDSPSLLGPRGTAWNK